MGMPITIEVVGNTPETSAHIEEVFAYMTFVDERFSTYKDTSEITRINRGEIGESDYSDEMREVFALAEKTKLETQGFFDMVRPDGSKDPSGIVKGWAINNAADLLVYCGEENFYIDAGGDIQTRGHNSEGGAWSVGIRNPFLQNEIVKVLYPKDRGIATSGTYTRGTHIYNPHTKRPVEGELVSLTVIGPNVCEADRFATGTFAMGLAGVAFIEQMPGFEAYAIDPQGIATMTSGLPAYTTL